MWTHTLHFGCFSLQRVMTTTLSSMINIINSTGSHIITLFIQLNICLQDLDFATNNVSNNKYPSQKTYMSLTKLYHNTWRVPTFKFRLVRRTLKQPTFSLIFSDSWSIDYLPIKLFHLSPLGIWLPHSPPPMTHQVLKHMVRLSFYNYTHILATDTKHLNWRYTA